MASYVEGEVYPLCAPERERLDACGLGATGLRSVADLRRLPPIDAAEVDGLDAVLRPSAETLGRSSLRGSWRWARLTFGRRRFIEEVVDPRYRPVHFDDHDGLIVASTDSDLDRLADLGRRWLEQAGVRRTDALVSLLPARPDLAFWQLALGCRRGGVPGLHLGDDVPAADVASYAPTVLVGRVEALRRLAADAEQSGADLSSVTRVLVAGQPLGRGNRAALAEHYHGATVLAAWAPPGVRALWAECTGGVVHTWPDTEVIELVGADDRPVPAGAPGRIVWSPLGWRGTVVLRLRTPQRARLASGPCPGCGRESTRLEPAAAVKPATAATTTPRAETTVVSSPPDRADPVLADLESALADVLDRDSLVAAWQAEHHPAADGGHAGLLVRVTPRPGARAALESALPGLGRELGANRILVERPSVLRARLAAAGGRRVVEGT